MSLMLQEFLVSAGNIGSHFACNVPRPPVPGEENENKPTSAGVIGSASSTRSSGSYRSHISGRSLSSGKSKSSSGHSSAKSRSSARSKSSSGSIDKTAVELTAATPRKSNLERTLTEGFADKSLEDDDCRAPLGFEPEGSVNGSQVAPPFVENSPQPACLRWAENLESLLVDRDGVRLFRRFLEEESDAAPLDFIFACRGLAMVSTSDMPSVVNLIRTIYKKYLKGDRLGLRSDVKRSIADRIRRGDVDCAIFGDAVRLVEDSLRCDVYLAFLKSDMYLMYVQLGGSNGSADSSSGSSDSALQREPPAPTGHGALATVHEEQELHDVRGAAVTLELTEASLVATQKLRGTTATALSRGDRYVGTQDNSSSSRRPAVNPYHVSYAPVSSQDSELQSMSSDAPTDDNSHTTDSHSSCDGELSKKSTWKKLHRSIRCYASANQHTDLDKPFIPRTEVAPRDRNLAENDPKQFASMLIDKLQKVKNDLDERDKLNRIVQTLSHSESLCNTSKPPRRPVAPPTLTTRSATTLPAYSLDYIVFPTGVEIDMDLDDYNMGSVGVGPDSILEEHVSRVWEDANRLNNTSSLSSFSSSASVNPRRSCSGNFVRPSPDVSSSSFARFSAGIPTSARHSFSSGFGSGDSCGRYAPSDLRSTTSEYPPHRQIHSTPKTKPVPGHVSSQSDSEMWDHSRQDTSSMHASSGHGLRTSSEESVDFMSRGSAHCLPPSYSSQPNLLEAVDNRSSYNPTIQQQSAAHLSCSSLCSGPFHDHSSSFRPPVAPADPRTTSQSRRSWSAHRSQLSSSSSTHGLNPHLSSALHSRSLRGHSEPLLDAGVNNSCNVLDLSAISNTQQHSTNDLCTSQQQNVSSATATGRHQQVSSSSQQQQQPGDTSSVNNGGAVTVVGFYLCDEEIPYRTTISSTNVTLGQFKQLVSKRGNYRYFFKKACDEFGSGVVLEEAFDDDEILPLWEGKIIGRVERR